MVVELPSRKIQITISGGCSIPPAGGGVEQGFADPLKQRVLGLNPSIPSM
jgi:hypothetical protein